MSRSYGLHFLVSTLATFEVFAAGVILKAHQAHQIDAISESMQYLVSFYSATQRNSHLHFLLHSSSCIQRSSPTTLLLLWSVSSLLCTAYLDRPSSVPRHVRAVKRSVVGSLQPLDDLHLRRQLPARRYAYGFEDNTCALNPCQ